MKMNTFLCIVAISTVTCIAEAQRFHTEADNYFPLSLGNRWTYLLVEKDKPSPTTITWKVTQVDSTANSFSLWATPPDGDEPFNISPTKRGLLETQSKRLFIESVLKIGDRWSTTDTDLNGNNKNDSFELLEAGKPCVAGSHSFEDCIVIKEVNETTQFISITTYAKNVGPVKYVYFDRSHPNRIRSTMTIKSWKAEKAA